MWFNFFLKFGIIKKVKIMNKYSFKEINSDEFAAFSQSHKQNHIFQTIAWSQVKANWSHCFLAVFQADQIVAATLVLKRDLKFGYKFAYLPRGPLLDFTNQELKQYFFKNLKINLKKDRCLLVKLDPNLKIASLEFEQQSEVATCQNPALVKSLTDCGLVHNGYVLEISQAIQPRIQLGFPIEDSVEKIDARIGRKTMKKVRASMRKGVEFRFESDASNLAKLINYTEKRHHIHLRNEQYFNAILKAFKEDATVLTAYIDDIPIASCLLVKSQSQAEILYSGYHDDYKKYNSTYPMRYQAILWAFKNHCQCFNFGGVEGTLDDGLTMFKSAFRPLIDVYIGEFDLLTFPIVSKLLSKMFYKLKNKVKI